MRVTIQLFAEARRRAGAAALALELPEGAAVADLRRALAEARPALGPLLPSLWIAVDSEYAADDLALNEAQEIAAFPPVSGGLGTLATTDD